MDMVLFKKRIGKVAEDLAGIVAECIDDKADCVDAGVVVGMLVKAISQDKGAPLKRIKARLGDLALAERKGREERIVFEGSVGNALVSFMDQFDIVDEKALMDMKLPDELDDVVTTDVTYALVPETIGELVRLIKGAGEKASKYIDVEKEINVSGHELNDWLEKNAGTPLAEQLMELVEVENTTTRVGFRLPDNDGEEKKQRRAAKKKAPAKKRGRPKGSKNKPKTGAKKTTAKKKTTRKKRS